MSGRLLFQCGPQQLHIGVERDFRPAKKAHPAFVADDLEALRQVFLLGGVKITDDHSLPGTRRFFAEDLGATGSNSLRAPPHQPARFPALPRPFPRQSRPGIAHLLSSSSACSACNLFFLKEVSPLKESDMLLHRLQG